LWIYLEQLWHSSKLFCYLLPSNITRIGLCSSFLLFSFDLVFRVLVWPSYIISPLFYLFILGVDGSVRVSWNSNGVGISQTLFVAYRKKKNTFTLCKTISMCLYLVGLFFVEGIILLDSVDLFLFVNNLLILIYIYIYIYVIFLIFLSLANI